MNIDFVTLIKSLQPGRLGEFGQGYNAALIELIQSADISEYFGGLNKDDKSNPLKKGMYRMGYHNLYNNFSKENVESLNKEIRGNNRLQAIKYLKELTGLGLKEAKEVIDAGMFE